MPGKKAGQVDKLGRFRTKLKIWEPIAARIGAVIATIAAIGAILGGLVGYWDTYKVVVHDVLGLHHPGESRPIATPGSHFSIAILPFDSLGDAAASNLGIAIADHLTTDLSVHVPGLTVIGEDSAFTYLGKAIDPKKVGRDLGAYYLLHGSVQRSGSSVRINTRLIETENGKQVWAERFDDNSADLFTLLDRISGRIANSFGAALMRDSATDAEQRSANPKATDLVFRAQAAFLLNNRSLQSLNEAEPLYRQALAIDADNGDALIGLGYLLAVRVVVYRAPMSSQQVASIIAESRDLLDRGSKSRPNSALVHNARGRLYFVEGKLNESLEEHELARSLDPNFAVNYHNLALVLIALGQPGKAITYLNEAVRRSPLDPLMGLLDLHIARAQVLLGKWDEAIDAGLKARVLRTDLATLNYNMAAAYAQKDDVNAARTALEESRRVRPLVSIAALKSDPELSNAAYLKIAEPTLFDGLRKAGVSER